MQDNFWNEFFSTDKIFIPAIITVIFGLIVLMLCAAMNKQLNNNGLIVILCIGFFVGNVIKANILLSDHEKKLNGPKNKDNKNSYAKSTKKSEMSSNVNSTSFSNSNQSNKENQSQVEKGKIIRKK
jgi:hypothetical protein